MLLYLLQKATLCVFIYFALHLTLLKADEPSDGGADVWDEIFNLRGDDDWQKLWHVEHHRKCYQELENHMKWVCDKDIYKLNKKARSEPHVKVGAPFLTKEEAFSLLGGGRGRRSKRGIMDECCHGSAAGCSWEEYAEYCQHHSRVRS